MSEQNPDDLSDVDRAALAEEGAKMRRHMMEIGHFIHEFSQLEFSIRARIAAHFGERGDDLFVLIEGIDTLKLVDALPRLGRSRALSADQLKAIDAFHSAFTELNAQRVLVAHGLWSTDLSGNWGVGKRPQSKGAVDKKWSLRNPDEIRALSDQAQALMQASFSLPL